MPFQKESIFTFLDNPGFDPLTLAPPKIQPVTRSARAAPCARVASNRTCYYAIAHMLHDSAKMVVNRLCYGPTLALRTPVAMAPPWLIWHTLVDMAHPGCYGPTLVAMATHWLICHTPVAMATHWLIWHTLVAMATPWLLWLRPG
jgi:hypothetical protein